MMWEEIEREGKLKPEFESWIIERYGGRGERALRAVKERRVKKYRDYFVVVGKEDEYIVEEGFCTCKDFLFREEECWHSIAVRIAKLTGEYDYFDVWYQDIANILPRRGRK
ncbi:MAG: SWIM zinc finger family protein [Archaeoglobi archaeon]|nr:SWIM zinc finger family protein [Candidatus Mnemosynella sp.]